LKEKKKRKQKETMDINLHPTLGFKKKKNLFEKLVSVKSTYFNWFDFWWGFSYNITFFFT